MIDTMEIRKLSEEDSNLIEKMDTGIENDYVVQVLSRLTEGNNHLFGLFKDGEIAVVGGFTIYKKRYAMLGRLRSARKFRGQNLATELNQFLIKKVNEMEGVQWVGANTEEDNYPARRVLEKLGLPQLITLHGAVTKDLSPLMDNHKKWSEITSHDQKKKWVEQELVAKKYVFPYECYYPFLATWDLFENELEGWRFFENEDKTRFFILKEDQKKHHYLHVIYPWTDLPLQTGLWETVQSVYDNMDKHDSEEEVYIWIDLTKEEAKKLPADHPFTLPTPWILHGRML
jgi:GNAT superfamily N-acetyltransferase